MKILQYSVTKMYTLTFIELLILELCKLVDNVQENMIIES